jgi:hypothetical protein
MQSPRRSKSQLLSVSIILIVALIITTTTFKPPVDYGIAFRSSVDYIKKNNTITTISYYSSNRKPPPESSNNNIIPSSFIVVQKNNIGGRVSGSSLSNRSSSNLTKSAVVVHINRPYHIYTNTKNKNQVANLEHNNGNINTTSLADDIFNRDINIALVAPTFTAAAYDDNSFYTFYKLYSNTQIGTNVTSNLNLLSHKITNQDTLRASLVMLKLVDNLKLINPNSHITILTDADVDNGSLFNNKNHDNNIYDLTILGHQEYVTQQEYAWNLFR